MKPMRKVPLTNGVLVLPTLAIAVVLSACAAPMTPSSPPRPTEVTIGGVRPEITRAGLAAARVDMPGGLLEPCWLPEGTQLTHIAYTGLGPPATDIWYESGDAYLHMWQSYMGPDELGSDDPVGRGEPISVGGELDWRARTLSSGQTGDTGVAEYSTRTPDGRTISVDTNLAGDVVPQILASVCVRAGSGG